MSTVKTDNFAPSAGGTSFSTNGVSKVWVNFNGTSTVSVNESNNAASVTDGGTGSYVVNFTNDMDNINFCSVGIADDSSASDPTLWPDSAVTRSAGSMAVATGSSSSGSYGDRNPISVIVFGELA